VADALEITGATLSRIECGQMQVTAPLMSVLATALGCHPADLYPNPLSYLHQAPTRLRAVGCSASDRHMAYCAV
jgi:transcriptional regulator with XRE-family HTH domain